MEVTIKKDELVGNLKMYFTNDLIKNLKNIQDISQEEIDANLVLAQRKINDDAETITNLVFEVSLPKSE
jgi:hypothetical protein